MFQEPQQITWWFAVALETHLKIVLYLIAHPYTITILTIRVSYCCQNLYLLIIYISRKYSEFSHTRRQFYKIQNMSEWILLYVYICIVWQYTGRRQSGKEGIVPTSGFGLLSRYSAESDVNLVKQHQCTHCVYTAINAMLSIICYFVELERIFGKPVTGLLYGVVVFHLHTMNNHHL